MTHLFSHLHKRCPAQNSGSGSRTLLAGSLIALLFGSLLFSTPVVAQDAPVSFDVISRDARETYAFDRPGIRYVPGYFPTTGSSDYVDSDTVYRLEFGVNNDGTISQIPETSRFQLTAGGEFFLPLVRNIRGGVIREPFDEVVAVRILDGDPSLIDNENENDDQLMLCDESLDNDSGEACEDVDNINKNSYFHAYSAGHRDEDVVGGPIDAVDYGTDGPDNDTETAQQECYDAYVEFFGQDAADATDPAPTCPVVRYQSERATCIKCITNQYALHRGSDNIFSKDATTRNNIGRLDLIIREPIVFTQDDADAFEIATSSDGTLGNDGENLFDNVGFLILERGGNDPIDVAAITGIEDIDEVAAGNVDLDAYSNSNPDLETDLEKMARLIRTYDDPSLELQLVDGEIEGVITPGRAASSIVTELGPLLEVPDTDSWGSTGESFLTTVFMNSNPAEGETGHFIENRPDQDLTEQDVAAKFISLADLGIGVGDEFFGVSLFASDVEPDQDTALDEVVSGDGIMDLITLRDIPRQTSGASGAGGLDLMGGGGFFFREDTPQDPTVLTLGECWRTLSSPIEGQTYDSFFSSFSTDGTNYGGLWTQGSGIDGARAQFGDPNVYTMNSAGTAWEPIPDLTQEIPAGTGILISVFDEDEYENPASAGFPKTAPLLGPERAAPITVDFTSDFDGTSIASDGFSLLGNPFKLGIDFDVLIRTNVGPNVWVYDRNNGTSTDIDGNTIQGNWVSWNSNAEEGEITDGVIAPGQGFVVQNVGNDPNPSVTFNQASRLEENDFYGKSYNRPDHMRLEVSGKNVYNSAWVQFTEDGSMNVSKYDAAQFMPFESDFAVLSTMKEGQMFDISRFPHVNEEVEIPIMVETTTTAPLTLRLTDMQYRQSGTLYLYDTVTGSSMELQEGMEYEFTPSGTPAKSLNSCYSTPQKAKTTGKVRFLITSNVPQNEPDIPAEFSLEQNYPNPFNPTTQITYQLPQQSDVRLQVFDMAGRQVATLVSENVNAGTHTVNFDASNLSSGVYMYRLQAGSTVLTRKLTLIK